MDAEEAHQVGGATIVPRHIQHQAAPSDAGVGHLVGERGHRRVLVEREVCGHHRDGPGRVVTPRIAVFPHAGRPLPIPPTVQHPVVVGAVAQGGVVVVGGLNGIHISDEIPGISEEATVIVWNRLQQLLKFIAVHITLNREGVAGIP